MKANLNRLKLDKQLKRYLLVLLGLILVLSLAIVPVESGYKIKTIGDGLWWAVVTVTTVGYGDLVPMTMLGKLIGAVLMVAGIAMFWLVIAVITAKLVGREEKYWRKKMKKDLESINNKLYRMEKKLEFLIKAKE